MAHKHGNPGLPPELRRSERLTVMVRPGDLADLVDLANGWGVPVSAAAWSILSDYLAELRREGHQADGLILAASRRLVDQAEKAREGNGRG